MIDNQNHYKTTTLREASRRQRLAVKRTGQAIVLLISTASALVSFTVFGISWTTIVIIAISLCLLLSLLANALYFIDSRNQSKGPKKIAFLTPSSGGQPFYATMLIGLVRSAALALGQNYIVLPSMPAEPFETVSIWSLFASLEDRQLEIDGIIFIPDQPDNHFEELVTFHEKKGDVPLVLVDVYFDLAACDDRTRARLPSFVGGDEVTGGRIAAELILEAVGAAEPDPAVVLVINGRSTPWEKQRALAFRKHLNKAWPHVKFLETPSIDYSRPEALKQVHSLMEQQADSAKNINLNAIFACNDDMAIGARAAVLRLVREGYIFQRPPQIVGYDGITEIQEYIDAGDPYIAGTVDVLIEEQAKAAMLLMHELLRSGQRRSKVQLITPRPIRRNYIVASSTAQRFCGQLGLLTGGLNLAFHDQETRISLRGL